MVSDTRLDQLNTQLNKLILVQSQLFDDLNNRNQNNNLLIKRLQTESDEKIETIKSEYERKIDNCQRDFNNYSSELNRKLTTIKNELPNLQRQIEKRTEELRKEEKINENTSRFHS